MWYYGGSYETFLRVRAEQRTNQEAGTAIDTVALRVQKIDGWDLNFFGRQSRNSSKERPGDCDSNDSSHFANVRRIPRDVSRDVSGRSPEAIHPTFRTRAQEDGKAGKNLDLLEHLV